MTHHPQQLQFEPEDEITAESASAARSDSTANFVIEIDVEDSAKTQVKLTQCSKEEENKEETKLWMHNCEQVVSTMESKQKSETGKNTTIKDFESLKVLGTGTYGKVMLVRHKISRKLYAMKVLKISVIREKN